MTCKEAIYSNDVYDFITDFPVDERWQNLEPIICFEGIEDRYNILHIDKEDVPNQETSSFEYQSVPKLYGLMQDNVEGAVNGGETEGETEGLDGSESVGNIEDRRNTGRIDDILRPAEPFAGTSLIESGILQVQRPPLSLTGRGVVICIIDTGIDYRNPAFLDANGQSRILAIWDQTIQDGIPPEGFAYGAEYTKEQINEALAAENPFEIVPSRDQNGHGTALASVAAGSRLSATQTIGTIYPAGFVGAAPEADIVVVKLKEAKQYLKDTYLVGPGVPAYQENDIMTAIEYADRFVRLFLRPVVFCIGLGTNMGDHSGSSALSQYLSQIAVRRNRAVVVCGGNEGNAAHHFQGNLKTEDTYFLADGNGRRAIDVEIRVDEGNNGFLLELWGNLPDIFEVSIRSPGGERISPTGLQIRQSVTYGFVYERTTITVDSSLVEPSSGEELILFRMRNPTPGIWTFTVGTIGEVYNGNFHMWLPITQFLNSPAFFLRPSPYVTLTEPAMVPNPIAVSYYNPENRSFAIDSGRGFNRLNMIRPDLSAPGVGVETITGKRSGASFAAAITAGAVAQFFQWAVVERNQLFAESREIQSFFLRGAARNRDLSYPNREWGYGRLNLEGVFESLVQG